jgi:GNAT superfamily N-acetyltransferase
MPRLELVRTTSDAPAAEELTDRLEAELVERYGPGGGASMPRRKADEYTAFVVAFVDHTPVACGGVCRHTGTDTAEVHRMYTRPDMRGRGYAIEVLAELERAAAEAGCTEMVLETGTLNPEAVALYQRCGYRPIPAYGPYVDTPHSRCFGRSLTAG